MCGACLAVLAVLALLAVLAVLAAGDDRERKAHDTASSRAAAAAPNLHRRSTPAVHSSHPAELHPGPTHPERGGRLPVHRLQTREGPPLAD